jgi:hypothetical protein
VPCRPMTIQPAPLIPSGSDMGASWNGIPRRRPGTRSTLLRILAVVFVLSNVVYGQTTSTAALVGKVLYPFGAMIPGAEVHLTNYPADNTESVTSDAAENFHFLLLSPGIYELQASNRFRNVPPF